MRTTRCNCSFSCPCPAAMHAPQGVHTPVMHSPCLCMLPLPYMPPAMHTPCHACPLPHMSPPPTMHAWVPHTPHHTCPHHACPNHASTPCHTHPHHACPPPSHAPGPCMSPTMHSCHTCPLPCTPPSKMHAPHVDRILDNTLVKTLPIRHTSVAGGNNKNKLSVYRNNHAIFITLKGNKKYLQRIGRLSLRNRSSTIANSLNNVPQLPQSMDMSSRLIFLSWAITTIFQKVSMVLGMDGLSRGD